MSEQQPLSETKGETKTESKQEDKMQTPTQTSTTQTSSSTNLTIENRRKFEFIHALTSSYQMLTLNGVTDEEAKKEAVKHAIQHLQNHWNDTEQQFAEQRR